jgi:hypothetical protein
MLACVIVFQWLGKLLGDAIFPGVGSTILVGSLVNLVLYVTTIFCGVIGAVCVGLLTPVMALVIGQLAFPILIPFVGLGNVILVLAFWAIAKYVKIPDLACKSLGVVGGSLLKFLYMGFALVALLPVLGFNEKQVAMMSVNYGWVQLVAAIIGGIIFYGVYKGLQKAGLKSVSELFAEE